MTAKKVFFILLGCLIAVVFLGLASLFGGDQLLAQEAGKLFQQKLTASQLNNEQTALAQAKQDVIKYSSLNTVAETIVPQDKDQALTVREIVAAAQQTGIKIGGITFPASTLGLSPTSGSPTGNSGPSGASSSPASNTTKPSHSGLTQVQPVKGLTGVYELPITVLSDGSNPVSFDQLTSFLQQLENDRHTAQVGQLTITPAGTGNAKLSFQLVINVYIKPS